MAEVLDLELQLQTTKKGASSCAQYLQQMQTLANRLGSIGTDVTDDDLVLYIAQGLGSEYESFITALSMRYAPPLIIEFSSLLLAHEARLFNNLKTSSTTALHLTTQPAPSDSTSQTPNTAYHTNGNRAQSY
jgi:gag-polypeptide of LTR copia-type